MLLPRILFFLSCLASPIYAQDYEALLTAVARDRAQSVHIAIQKGVDVNDDSAGMNVLVVAVLEEKLNALQALLHQGADYTLRMDDGSTLFDMVAEDGLHRVLNVLANFKDKNGKYVVREALLKEPHPEDGLYSMHRACKEDSSDHAKVVKEFIDMGVPWDLKTTDGKTCMDLTTNQSIKDVLYQAEAEAKWEKLGGNGEEL